MKPFVILDKFLAFPSRPRAVAATLLQQSYWRKGDVPAFREAPLELRTLHRKTREADLDWRFYQDLRNADAGIIPTTSNLCRAAENVKNFDLA